MRAMAVIEISGDEQNLLREVLESEISDMRVQIVNTDTSSFRDQLKRRRDMLQGLLERLAA
jgi:hypothetical protein